MMIPGENRADLEANTKPKQNRSTTWCSDAPVRPTSPNRAPGRARGAHLWLPAHSGHVGGLSGRFCPHRGAWCSLYQGISPILQAGRITESHAPDIELVATEVHVRVQERMVPRTRLLRLGRTAGEGRWLGCHVSTEEGCESRPHLQSQNGSCFPNILF